MRITIDRSVAGLLRLGWFELSGIEQRGREALDREMAEVEEACRRLHGGLEPGQIEGLRPARRLYRAIGVDPTKTRPSSEALLRRILRGKGLYRLLPAVDAANLCSLKALLPVGLYDLDRIEGKDVRVKRGEPGDAYPGIGRGEIHLEGRLALYDAAGPFGNPTADSDRTKVKEVTRSLLFVYFAPADHPAAELERRTTEAAATMRRHVGGSIAEQAIL